MEPLHAFGRDPWWRDPFQEFEDMWTRMSRMFEHAWAGRAEEGPWTPFVEVDDQDDAYLIRVEVPGFRREDVQVEVDEQGLSITGRHGTEDGGDVLRHRSGRFSYQANLPRDASAEKAEASLRDGVLTVRLPRTGPKGRRIQISGD